MQGIPPATDTDAEDVVWGLQTADALWKRGERIDALVWLRRAAQAASEAGDDARAVELARFAAELSDWVASQPLDLKRRGSTQPPRPAPPSRPAGAPLISEGASPPLRPGATNRPPRSAPPSRPVVAREVSVPPPLPPRASSTPKLLTRSSRPEPDELRNSVPSVLPADKVHAGMFDPWGEQPPSSKTSKPAPSTPADDEGVVTSVRPDALTEVSSSKPSQPVKGPASGPDPKVTAPKPPPLPPRAKPPLPPRAQVSTPSEPTSEDLVSEPPPTRVSVPPLRPDVVQLPKLDALPRVSVPVPPPLTPPPPVEAPRASDPAPPSVDPDSVPATLTAGTHPDDRDRSLADVIAAEAEDVEDPDELIVTSVRLDAAAEYVPPQPPEGRRSERATAIPDGAPPDAELVPPLVEPREPEPFESGRVISAPEPSFAVRASDRPSDSNDIAAGASDRPPEPSPLVASLVRSNPPPRLTDVEALADLPDDAREVFSAAARVHDLAEGEEIGQFALALVIEGSFDVAATMVDAPAVRLQAGEVLRARGTRDEGVPIRLICAQSQGRVATWSPAEVDEAFRTCPWVEDDLRTAADRVQALVGITIGPLGERLDARLREQIVARLTLRTLLPGEVIVPVGKSVPGLFLVAMGEIEVTRDDEVVGVIAAGEFVFPGEVLGAGSAPGTARAGKGGALVMWGDRMVAQELLVTCPPLLEVFAGM